MCCFSSGWPCALATWSRNSVQDLNMNSCSVPGSRVFHPCEPTNTQWKKLEVVGSLGAEVDYNHDGGLLATGGLKVGNQHQVPTNYS